MEETAEKLFREKRKEKKSTGMREKFFRKSSSPVQERIKNNLVLKTAHQNSLNVNNKMPTWTVNHLLNDIPKSIPKHKTDLCWTKFDIWGQEGEETQTKQQICHF